MAEDLRYPIGKAVIEKQYSTQQRAAMVEEISAVPKKLRAAVEKMSEAQIDTPYRPEGWTVRQLVHHIADSHMNALMRFKLALTEDVPTIKPYDEQRWAELGDSALPIEVSLRLVDGVHERWAALLRSMKPEDFARGFKHPERGEMTLDMNLGLYHWHGSHHIAHITELKKRSGWN